MCRVRASPIPVHPLEVSFVNFVFFLIQDYHTTWTGWWLMTIKVFAHSCREYNANWHFIDNLHNHKCNQTCYQSQIFACIFSFHLFWQFWLAASVPLLFIPPPAHRSTFCDSQLNASIAITNWPIGEVDKFAFLSVRARIFKQTKAGIAFANCTGIDSLSGAFFLRKIPKRGG